MVGCEERAKLLAVDGTFSPFVLCVEVFLAVVYGRALKTGAHQGNVILLLKNATNCVLFFLTYCNINYLSCPLSVLMPFFK